MWQIVVDLSRVTIIATMSFYRSTDQFYICAQALFSQILQDDPQAAASLQKSRLSIRIRCVQPIGEIFIDGTRMPVQTYFGQSPANPILDITMPADTLHQILLGQLTLTKALGSGKLQVKGPILKATVLADLFRYSQTIYPNILRTQGLLT